MTTTVNHHDMSHANTLRSCLSPTSQSGGVYTCMLDEGMKQVNSIDERRSTLRGCHVARPVESSTKQQS